MAGFEGFHPTVLDFMTPTTNAMRTSSDKLAG